MTQLRTLAIDIGGTGIKAALIDEDGRMISQRERVPTPPAPISRAQLLGAIDKAAGPLGSFDRVSVGFPGYVRDGRIVTAPNLGNSGLGGFDLQGALAEHWHKPVRVLNDADVQGFGAIRGKGLEMALTLGTGVGTALFKDGVLLPHLELAHHPIRGRKTYDEYIGKQARIRKGKKLWNRRVALVIDTLREVVHFDHLYIGGGNAGDITFELPADVSIVPNTDGLTGGVALWREVVGAPPPKPAARASRRAARR